MAKSLLTLEEVIVILQSMTAPEKIIARVQTQAEMILSARNQREVTSDDPEAVQTDAVSVASTFGQRTQRGYVELTLNEQRTQMEPKKAREIGLMLIEAAEAATSDELLVTFLKRLDVTEPAAHARALSDLREIRQGTRGTSWAS